MKKLRTLYLILADEGFRLVHTLDTGLAELDVKGGMHVSASGHSDARTEQDRARLAHEAAAALQAEWGKGLHDRIVLSAPPKMLHDLRVALKKDVHAHVKAELHKDLYKVPAHDLEAHFSEVPAA